MTTRACSEHRPLAAMLSVALCTAGLLAQYGCATSPGWYPDFGGVIENDGIVDNAGTPTNRCSTSRAASD